MGIMRKFPNIDLNLLKVFASLYHTGSVTLSAEELNISQSACSHALQRLRERLGDDLFIRIENRMLPTAYSERLAEQVLPGLALLGQGLASSHPFTPEDAHVFRIAVTDYTSWCLREFITYLSESFPHIQIEFMQLAERLPESALKSAAIDLVCGFAHQQEESESLNRLVWLSDHYVSVRCQSHPVAEHLSLAQFLQYPHVLVTPWNEPRGIVDMTLSRQRKKRQIAIRTASVLAAPYFVQQTSYLLAAPSRYAHTIAESLSLRLSPMPLDVPDYQLTLYWHKTRHNDPKIAWFVRLFSDFHQCS
ncbi:DNA-binding transcriptional regulator, LysR family [Vibrio gazogenes DSM 21264]|uniref:DNA-binding transcriptional regulator, LysR family n=2 Tax=Vibrio gazogenes TaxID=687 RepID=A0A1M5HNR2_VIBGA|nr:DNA-binding transcriptional regulator, LysR family [Vibrio gazogenes DSM 21264] [Vibrio gazogenes DSM 21264 = NBRC 103151]SJN57535.1 Nodulation protein D 2 [Vibrio gazogenes]